MKEEVKGKEGNEKGMMLMTRTVMMVVVDSAQERGWDWFSGPKSQKGYQHWPFMGFSLSHGKGIRNTLTDY